MSLIGFDISGSYEDMFIINKTYNIKLFQISASSLSNYLNKIGKQQKQIKIPKNFKVVVHYSYSINLAHIWEPRDWWIQQTIQEIKNADKIGAFAYVVHTGKRLKYSENVAINNMFSALLYIDSQTSDTNVKILIETPAGQGTETLTDLNDLIKFVNKFKGKYAERFGLCIDTCHIYSAGYDISQKTVIEEYFNLINEKMDDNINRLKLVHLNNSKTELGSRIDRHAPLNDGKLNNESIRMIVQFINKLEIPMIMETPTGHNYESVLNDYKILKEYVNNK